MRLIVAVLAATTVVITALYATGLLTVAVVSGDSMSPAITQGDLVFLRKDSAYEPGQIVAYNNPDLGLLLHRIVARADTAASGPDAGESGERFVLQGDNKNLPDGYQPLPSEIRGRLLWRLPGVGKPFDLLRDPLVLAVVTAVGAGLILWPMVRKSVRRRVAMRAVAMHTKSRSRQIMGALLAATVISAVAFAVSQTIGTTREASIANPYQQLGTFAYTAEGGEGVYDLDLAFPGDPVFPAITDTVDLSFNYGLNSPLVTAVNGDYRMEAQIRQSNGWTRTVELIPSTPFDQASLTVNTVVNFADLQRLVDRAIEQTGVTENSYTLTLAAEVDVQAVVAGRPLVDRLEARIKFLVDEKQALMLPDTDDGDPPSDTRTASVFTSQTEARVFSQFGVDLRVADARATTTVLFGASLALLGIVGMIVRSGTPRDEAALIRARFRHLLMPAEYRSTPESALIQLVRFSDLVRLAEAEGLPIFDERLDMGARFTLVKADGVYFYSPGAAFVDGSGAADQPSGEDPLSAGAA